MSALSDSQNSKVKSLLGLSENENLIVLSVTQFGELSTLLKEVKKTLEEIKSDIDRFRPLVEQYEMAKNAGGFLKQRKILRQGMDRNSGLSQ